MALQASGLGGPDDAVNRCIGFAASRSAGFAGAFFFAGGVVSPGVGFRRTPDFGGFRFSRARIWRQSDLVASDLAATPSRGGASSGRSAGSSGAICGSGSNTSHWQIL